MKNIFIYLAFIGLLLSYSCNEEFLELKAPVEPTLESYYIDTATAFNGLVGCYNSMQMISLGNIFKLDIRSDDIDLAGDPLGEPGPIDNEWFANFVIYSDNGLSASVWSYCYKGIYTVNTYLEGVSAINLSDPGKQKLIDQYKAEATFMRAYFYFTLVKNYSAVPLITKPLAPSEWYSQVRVPEPDVYQQIKTDLRVAIPNLKLKKELSAAEAGRITKGGAMALLSKVLITEAGTDASRTANWQEAWDLTNDIIQNSAQYDLSTNFEDVFSKQKEFGPESVFEIVFDENIAGETDPFVHALTPRIFFVNGKPTEMKLEYGFGSFGITENLANQYGWHQTDDSLTRANLNDIRGIYTFWTRFDRFLGLIPVDNLTQRPETKKPELLYDNANYYARKYNRTSAASQWAVAGMNWMVIRYAEVYLLAAEAAWYLGDEVNARLYVNAVRERAFRKAISEGRTTLDEVSIKSSGTALRDDIWQERRLELAGEADRFYDLKRTNRLEEVSYADKPEGTQFEKGKHELLPIPYNELNVAPLLTQNNGY